MALIRWKQAVDVGSWSPMADLSTDLFSMRDEVNRDGILTIEIPKSEEVKPKKISVRTA